MSTSSHVSSMSTNADEQTVRTDYSSRDPTNRYPRHIGPVPTFIRPKQPHLLASPPYDLPSHPILLLSDSASPLGSFAFSSGLGSYLAHHLSAPTTTPTTAAAASSWVLRRRRKGCRCVICGLGGMSCCTRGFPVHDTWR